MLRGNRMGGSDVGAVLSGLTRGRETPQWDRGIMTAYRGFEGP